MTRRKLTSEADSIIIGGRIRRIRQDQKMTMREAADMIGISYQQLQKYESGVNSITVPAMYAIAEALGVHACEICGCDHARS